MNGGTNAIISDDARPTTNLAMDEQNVYFGASDGLYRVAKVGGAAERLADGAVQNVAIDGTCVYWADTDTYTIFTLPK